MLRLLKRAMRNGRDGERGFVLVWFALMLVVLIAIGGIAVDFAHWFQVGGQEQKAADAAALAGAVFLPEDLTNAQSTAIAIAKKNGFTITDADVVRGDRPDQLKVTVSTTTNNILASVIGFGSTTITKTATGEYQKPVAMGSPTNQFGNDPESTATPGSPSYPNMWASIAGPANPKINGDAYAAGSCSSGPDLCTGAPTPDRSCAYSGGNSDFSCHGYDYTVHVPSGGSTFQIQAFDAGFVNVGNNCGGANDDAGNLAAAQKLKISKVQGWPSTVQSDGPGVRYHPVASTSNPNDPGLRYCTGDNSDGDPKITTTYTVLGPAAIPGDVASAPPTPVCTKVYPAVDGDLSKRLTAPTPKVAVSPSPEYLGQYFRQWDNLCPSNVSASAGDYFVRVQTNLTTGGAPNTVGNGHNRFALRATDTNVQIYGNANMGAYADAGASLASEFYLARLTPGASGRTLDLRLFDIGDADQAGTLTIKPPREATDRSKGGQPITSFIGCTYQRGTGASFRSTGPGCTIGDVNHDDYNGRWLDIKVPMPDGYDCNSADPAGCWIKIRYSFPGQISDTTSWTASVDGDPVRLIR